MTRRLLNLLTVLSLLCAAVVVALWARGYFVWEEFRLSSGIRIGILHLVGGRIRLGDLWGPTLSAAPRRVSPACLHRSNCLPSSSDSAPGVADAHQVGLPPGLLARV